MLAITTALTVLSALSAQVLAAPFEKRLSGVQIQIHNTEVPHEGPAIRVFCLATTQPGLKDGSFLNFQFCDELQTTDPTAANYGLWDISPGNQQGVRLTGTNFCLDAGLNPGPGIVGAKVWTCLPNTPQQQFYYTDDHRIAVTDYVPCLSSGRNGAIFQQCVTGYSSVSLQEFDLVSPGGSQPPVTTTISPPPVTATSTTTAQPTETPVTPVGKQLHPNGNQGKCLAVTGGALYNGAPVGISDCVAFTNYDESRFQFWEFNDAQTTLKIGGGYYCLDFGSGSGSNGTPTKIWRCYPGLYQQTLYYTGDDHIAVVGGNQCLDVQAGTSNVQSWQCSGPDVNQLFTS